VVNLRPQPGSRFNVLLTEDRPSAPGHWAAQFSRLLEPQGVASYVARTVCEALEMAEDLEIHAAVLDLDTPVGQARSPQVGVRSSGPTGQWVFELLRRLPNRPPLVIVHNATYSQRELTRLLREALKMGAFSVLNEPVQLEELLAVFQRLMDRQYRGAWPGQDSANG
jgi:CheY-like chemotaxis protein